MSVKQCAGLSVGFGVGCRFHPKSRQLFPLYFSNITLRTNLWLLTFGVTGTVFKIAGEMRRLPAYFDNPECGSEKSTFNDRMYIHPKYFIAVYPVLPKVRPSPKIPIYTYCTCACNS